MKTMQLKASINSRLRKALVGVKLPPVKEYAEWVAEVREVASEIEGFANYQPKGSAQSTTQVGPPKCGSAQRQDTQYDRNVDGNGDTFMTGTDAIIAAIKELRLQDNSRPSHKKKNKLNNSKKPRAPWRSKKEFRELLDKKLCV